MERERERERRTWGSWNPSHDHTIIIKEEAKHQQKKKRFSKRQQLISTKTTTKEMFPFSLSLSLYLKKYHGANKFRSWAGCHHLLHPLVSHLLFRAPGSFALLRWLLFKLNARIASDTDRVIFRFSRLQLFKLKDSINTITWLFTMAQIEAVLGFYK